MNPELIILITAMLAAAACGLIGSFLVIRQQAMLGDAISHAVLPGLVVAFLLSGSRDVVPMILGAAAMGIVTTWLTELLARSGRTYKDASLGIVFTLLFAIGVVLVSVFTGKVDLDQECVLYGEIAYTPFDRWVSGGVDLGPRPIWILGGALLLNLAFVLVGYRNLLITSFDPRLAKSLGLQERFWHYALMTVVSLTVVAAFESVGAILVVAMLIIPGATASLVTSRLPVLLGVAVGVGLLSAVGGYALSSRLDASIAGSMSVAAGVLFSLTAIVRGLVNRATRKEALMTTSNPLH